MVIGNIAIHRAKTIAKKLLQNSNLMDTKEYLEVSKIYSKRKFGICIYKVK